MRNSVCCSRTSVFSAFLDCLRSFIHGRDRSPDLIYSHFWIAGALSVLLVVGDTWCAVTDPLHYHSRISGAKSWILIAIVWLIGIAFGIASAFRNLFILRLSQRSESRDFEGNVQEMTHSYDLIFSLAFFLVIILLPFCLICGMYWQIYLEARQNGLRMRQNGSSPLLQSIVNLSQAPIGVATRLSPTSAFRQFLDLPKSADAIHRIQDEENLTTDELRRLALNVSSRHLPQLKGLAPLKNGQLVGEMRYVSSTPNLKKLEPFEFKLSPNNRSTSNIHASQPNHLQVPFCAPAKALSYMNSLRHRLSNASSIFKYREASRTARISVLVFVMFLASYFPYGILVLMPNSIGFVCTKSTVFSVGFLLVASFCSPFIFAYRSKRIRQGMLRLCHLDRRNKDRQEMPSKKPLPILVHTPPPAQMDIPVEPTNRDVLVIITNDDDAYRR